ncbi:MAG: ABC transporter substrate-binding protein [Actinomycetota bacterium]
MGKNPLLKLLALLAAFGLVAAACGSDDDDAGSGDTDGVLTLGGLLPETGNLAFLGPPEIAGVQLAVNDINAAGGVLGEDVVWLPGDSGDNGDVANATVDRLLAEDVDAFIGAASSGVSLTVIDKITQAGVIHFSPANTSPAFTDYDDSGLYFRTAPSDVVQGAALADIVLADGAETVSYLVLNDSYGTGLLEFSKGPYEAGGGTVVSENIYDPKAENFDAEISAVVEADPDAIIIIGFEETAQILQGLIEQGFGPADKLVYGTDGNMGNALAGNFDDPSVLAGMKGTLPGVDVDGTLGDFRDNLLAIDGDLEDYSYSAESYDAVMLVALGAIAAGTDDPTAIAAEINDITQGGTVCTSFEQCSQLIEDGEDVDYDGFSGPLSFIDAGEPSEASILTLQFNSEGSIEVVGSVFGKLDG